MIQWQSWSWSTDPVWGEIESLRNQLFLWSSSATRTFFCLSFVFRFSAQNGYCYWSRPEPPHSAKDKLLIDQLLLWDRLINLSHHEEHLSFWLEWNTDLFFQSTTVNIAGELIFCLSLPWPSYWCKCLNGSWTLKPTAPPGASSRLLHINSVN